MNVLGIETATAICAAALVKDGVVIAESRIDAGRVHAERLMGQIGEVLGMAGVESLDGVAVSIGPGSFTGLRIGVSVAKGIAYARGIPIAGVPTLAALALHAAETDRLSPGTHLLAALDARRDEVYCQMFDVTGEGLLPLREVRDLTLRELLDELRGSIVLLTGDGAAKVHSWPGAGSTLSMVSEEARRPNGGTVARLGERLLRDGKSEDPALLEPRYIKEFFLKSR